MEYNFIIIPAGSRKPKQYCIRANFPSKIGLWEKDSSFLLGPIDFSPLISKLPAQIRIEFVDYSAARHFLAQIEEWYEALDAAYKPQYLSKLQSMSHWLRPSFATVTMIVVIYSFYSNFLDLNPAELNNEHLFRLICLVSMAAAAGWFIGHALGRITEWAIDRVQPLSYVKLNRGDERCLGNWRKRNFKNILLSIFGIGSAIAINISSDLILSWLF